MTQSTDTCILGTTTRVLGVVPRVLGVVPRVLGVVPRVVGVVPRVLTLGARNHWDFSMGCGNAAPHHARLGPLAYPTDTYPPRYPTP